MLDFYHSDNQSNDSLIAQDNKPLTSSTQYNYVQYMHGNICIYIQPIYIYIYIEQIYTTFTFTQARLLSTIYIANTHNIDQYIMMMTDKRETINKT